MKRCISCNTPIRSTIKATINLSIIVKQFYEHGFFLYSTEQLEHGRHLPPSLAPSPNSLHFPFAQYETKFIHELLTGYCEIHSPLNIHVQTTIFQFSRCLEFTVNHYCAMNYVKCKSYIGLCGSEKKHPQPPQKRSLIIFR